MKGFNYFCVCKHLRYHIILIRGTSLVGISNLGMPPNEVTAFSTLVNINLMRRIFFTRRNSERQRLEKLHFAKGRKYSRGSTKAAKKFKDDNNVQDDKFLSHIFWWKEVNWPMLRILFCHYFDTLIIVEMLCIMVFLSLHSQTVESCKKPSSVQLVKRLVFSNLLGVDVNLKNGR